MVEPLATTRPSLPHVAQPHAYRASFSTQKAQERQKCFLALLACAEVTPSPINNLQSHLTCLEAFALPLERSRNGRDKNVTFEAHKDIGDCNGQKNNKHRSHLPCNGQTLNHPLATETHSGNHRWTPHTLFQSKKNDRFSPISLCDLSVP